MKRLTLLGIIALSFAVQAGNLEIGEEYFMNGNYEQAEKYLLKALENEDRAAAYNDLGILYKKQKNMLKHKKCM